MGQRSCLVAVQPFVIRRYVPLPCLIQRIILSVSCLRTVTPLVIIRIRVCAGQAAPGLRPPRPAALAALAFGDRTVARGHSRRPWPCHTPPARCCGRRGVHRHPPTPSEAEPRPWCRTRSHQHQPRLLWRCPTRRAATGQSVQPAAPTRGRWQRPAPPASRDCRRARSFRAAATRGRGTSAWPACSPSRAARGCDDPCHAAARCRRPPRTAARRSPSRRERR